MTSINFFQILKKSRAALGVALIASLIPSLVVADNPTSARVDFSIQRTNITRKGLEDLVIRVTHTFPVAQKVQTGGTCSVQLAACVSKFVPLGGTPEDSRRCTPVVIGSKTIGAGGRTARFTMKSKPVEAPRHQGRQVSFQTQSTCTDAIAAQAIIVSNPRARKVSRTDNRGVGLGRFYRSLTQSMR